MGRKALSKTRKAQLFREKHDHAMARAVALYKAEQASDGPRRKMGLCKCCKQIAEEYARENGGQQISLNHNTLLALVRGGRTQIDANAERRWTLPEEERVLINCIKEYADM